MKKAAIVKPCKTCGGATGNLGYGKYFCFHCGLSENTCRCNKAEIAKLLGMGIEQNGG